MKRYLLSFVLIVLCVVQVWGWPDGKSMPTRPGSMLGWDNASSTWRPIAMTGSGSLVIEGQLATGTMAVNEVPAAEIVEQTTTLVADTAEDISTALVTSTERKFIDISCTDLDKDFWISLTGTAVEDASRHVNGSIYLEIPIGVDVSIIASEALVIWVIEGGF